MAELGAGIGFFPNMRRGSSFVSTFLVCII